MQVKVRLAQGRYSISATFREWSLTSLPSPVILFIIAFFWITPFMITMNLPL